MYGTRGARPRISVIQKCFGRSRFIPYLFPLSLSKIRTVQNTFGLRDPHVTLQCTFSKTDSDTFTIL